MMSNFLRNQIYQKPLQSQQLYYQQHHRHLYLTDPACCCTRAPCFPDGKMQKNKKQDNIQTRARSEAWKNKCPNPSCHSPAVMTRPFRNKTKSKPHITSKRSTQSRQRITGELSCFSPNPLLRYRRLSPVLNHP